MTVPRGTRIAPLLLALTATACAGGSMEPVSSPAAPSTATDTLSAAQLEAIYHARQDSARTRFTPADVEFMQSMIGHHAQALVMAHLVPTRTDNQQIQILAARIINAQRDEIATMQRWLRERGQEVPEVHEMQGMPMAHGAGHAHMPGMLTEAQLQELAAARGAEFDRLFLTFMIQHHRGAVEMVHELFASDGAANDEAVFKFASDAQVDQSTEIARMERMLARLPPAPGP